MADLGFSWAFAAGNAIAMDREIVGIDAGVVDEDGFRALVAPGSARQMTCAAVGSTCDAAPWSFGCDFDVADAGGRISNMEAMFANEATSNKSGCSRFIFIGRARERDKFTDALDDRAHRRGLALVTRGALYRSRGGYWERF